MLESILRNKVYQKFAFYRELEEADRFELKTLISANYKELSDIDKYAVVDAMAYVGMSEEVLEFCSADRGDAMVSAAVMTVYPALITRAFEKMQAACLDIKDTKMFNQIKFVLVKDSKTFFSKNFSDPKLLYLFAHYFLSQDVYFFGEVRNLQSIAVADKWPEKAKNLNDMVDLLIYNTASKEIEGSSLDILTQLRPIRTMASALLYKQLVENGHDISPKELLDIVSKVARIEGEITGELKKNGDLHLHTNQEVFKQIMAMKDTNFKAEFIEEQVKLIE